ncbi:Tm-1-like ATP-binding domain-containing protein [Thermodesulfobacteriota bacterium]
MKDCTAGKIRNNNTQQEFRFKEIPSLGGTHEGFVMKPGKVKTEPAIAVMGTFDSKAEEHSFLKDRIEEKGFRVLTIHVGTKTRSPVPVNLDLYESIRKADPSLLENRDTAITAVLEQAKNQIKGFYQKGEISGIISAGGGTGTYLCANIMRELPLGIPKVMVSTVASRDMAQIVGTKDITMIHTVADLLGINSISGRILDQAAGAICGMVQGKWSPNGEKKRIALTMFGFITEAAERIKKYLEEMGYEVIAFHANGTGGMAMEELAAEGSFHGILDLATHELADELMGGYCRGIGDERLRPVPGLPLPRLVVPGGLDCAVLEFTRSSIPEEFENRKIFFYDFRSAIRLNEDETEFLAKQLAQKLNMDPGNFKLLVPNKGWSEADQVGAPLYDPFMSEKFIQKLKLAIHKDVTIKQVDLHINEPAFAREASRMMDKMIQMKDY